MSQHDYDIANQNAPQFRADVNLAFQALATLNSGATEPATTYAYMTWPDTVTELLNIRTAADDDWIPLGTLNQAAGEYRLLVESTTDIRASQAEALARTDNTKIMTPLRVEQLCNERTHTLFASGGNESGLGTSPTQRLSLSFNATTVNLMATATMRIAKSNTDSQNYFLDFRLYHTPSAALIANTVSQATADEAVAAACRIDAHFTSGSLTIGQAHRLEIWTYQAAATGTAFPSGMVISGLMV